METQAEVILTAVQVVASEKLQSGMAGNTSTAECSVAVVEYDNLDISELRLLLQMNTAQRIHQTDE